MQDEFTKCFLEQYRKDFVNKKVIEKSIRSILPDIDFDFNIMDLDMYKFMEQIKHETTSHPETICRVIEEYKNKYNTFPDMYDIRGFAYEIAVAYNGENTNFKIPEIIIDAHNFALEACDKINSQIIACEMAKDFDYNKTLHKLREDPSNISNIPKEKQGFF